MTTYGPYKRFTIRTLDAIITITGSNMVATVTSFDGGTPPQGFSITDVSSQNGATNVTKTARRENHPQLVSSSCVGESSSSPFHLQPSARGDTESVSPTPVMEKIPWQCPPDMLNPLVTGETTVDSDSNEHDDSGSTTDECGSPYHSESEQGCTTQSIVISSDSDYSDSESQLSEATAELQPLGSKRKCSNGDSDEEQSLMVRKYMCSSVGEVGGDVGNSSTDSNSLDSRLQVQSTNTTRKVAGQLGDINLRDSNSLDAESQMQSTATQGQPDPYTRVASHLCSTCGRTFFTAQGLTRHSGTHAGERPYSCSICGRTFARSGNLSQHARIHSGVKPYSCDTCGKSFTQSGSLAQHIRIHTGERPYSCYICGKSFKQSSYVTTHLRIHTGEKPFSCNTCGKTFNQSGSLSQHLRTHGVERPFSCNICGKTFKRSSYLATHIHTHTGKKPYSCDTCGKTFSTSGTLVQHVRMHTGERPFPCNICGKSFKQSSYVITHLRTHTGEKPYSCDICGKTFTRAGSLSQHARLHTV